MTSWGLAASMAELERARDRETDGPVRKKRERDNCTLVKEFQYGEKRFFCEKSQKQKVKIYFFFVRA